MQTSQQPNKTELFSRASFHQRITAVVVFLVIATMFGFSWLAATGKFDIGYWLGPCGFKQRYGLPCPTCGMTTAVLTFSQSRILEAFYIQPAAALICCVLIVIAFLALLTAVFGVYFMALKRLYDAIKIKYIIVALIIVITAAWAVTLARALGVSN